MQTFSDAFAFLAGLPALVGPVLAAAILVLATNWRWSIVALLFQYALVALALTHFVRPEVAAIKALVGVLAVMILYLSARTVPESQRELGPLEGAQHDAEEDGRRRFGLRVEWFSGPLGLPLRILAVLLMALALVRMFANYSLTLVPWEIAFVACWLGGMGVFGLVLSSDTLRVSFSALMILTGFDLVYASLEPSLTVVGFWGAFTLVAALAFSYLTAAQGFSAGTVDSEESEA